MGLAQFERREFKIYSKLQERKWHKKEALPDVALQCKSRAEKILTLISCSASCVSDFLFPTSTYCNQKLSRPTSSALCTTGEIITPLRWSAEQSELRRAHAQVGKITVCSFW